MSTFLFIHLFYLSLPFLPFYGWHGTLEVCLHQDEEDRGHEVVEDQVGAQRQALRYGLRLQWIRVHTV